ncbi:MAG: uroporphyrinogen-III C-methyltransferase, partial [Hyphomonadaceae bacterium]
CQIGAAAQSDSALGAVVLRGPLAIGVAAHGLAPELEAAMRGRLEAALPAGLAEFFAAAAAARETVEATLPAGAARAQFWTHLAGAAEHAAPRDWRAWIEAALDNAESARASD